MFQESESFVITELMFMILLLQFMTHACVKENNILSPIIIFAVNCEAQYGLSKHLNTGIYSVINPILYWYMHNM